MDAISQCQEPEGVKKRWQKQDEYFGEAYEELDRLSADEKKRLEYETRLKYKRDKYAQLHYATRIGREEGERIGREEGERIGREEGKSEMIRSMWKAGVSEEQIASIAQKTVEEVRKLCKIILGQEELASTVNIASGRIAEVSILRLYNMNRTV